jgi:hypothetical protein
VDELNSSICQFFQLGVETDYDQASMELSEINCCWLHNARSFGKMATLYFFEPRTMITQVT